MCCSLPVAVLRCHGAVGLPRRRISERSAWSWSRTAGHYQSEPLHLVLRMTSPSLRASVDSLLAAGTHTGTLSPWLVRDVWHGTDRTEDQQRPRWTTCAPRKSCHLPAAAESTTNYAQKELAKHSLLGRLLGPARSLRFFAWNRAQHRGLRLNFRSVLVSLSTWL